MVVLINELIKVVVLAMLLSCLQHVKALTEEMQELANQLHATCVEETGASESTFKSHIFALNDKIPRISDAISDARKGVFDEAESFKCYIKCLLSQMAIIDDDGVIDVDAMVAVMPEEMQEKSEPIIRKCGSVKGANACDSAWLTHKCYYKEGPEDYFLI
ncbi:general odorant-binding protein 83a-like isoform X1 [Euwallacea fornicatus]|uniref:general odorant-binding protein 83a-like isoform X1 n=1 Tax=Euwallacea fornicatus TaxID=995702 RepID=UPI00338F6346